MSAAQRHAWFNLAVIATTIVLVLALLPILGTRAQGGFGVLGLLGLGPWFFVRKGSEVVEDERDQMIRFRSGLIAFAIFWVAFVAACMALPAFYGWDGLVPVSVVLSFVWWGLIVVVGVMAVATLILSQVGGGDAD
jgi:hypothetical protein